MRRARVPAALGVMALFGLAACQRATPTPTPPPPPTMTPSATPTASITPTPSATPTPTFPVDALVVADALNLRAGPNVRHPQLGNLPVDAQLAIEGQSHDGAWLAVRDRRDRHGWVRTDLLTLRRPLASIPTQPTPSPPPPPTATAVPMDPSLPLVLSPPAVAQGDPALVRLRAPGAARVNAVLGAQTFPLQAVAPDTYAGILGIPPDLGLGTADVRLDVIGADGSSTSSNIGLAVGSGQFADEAIALDEATSKLLDPELREGERQRLATTVWSVESPEKRWSGAWRLPVTGTISSGFGTSRQYNSGVASSRHTGVDFRGHSGTPVHAAAAGRVAFAEALVARGKVVWIDHGWGVYSGYFHLSEIDVTDGQLIEAGTVLGRIGATGMVTGPHLHWEVRVHGQEVEPLQFLLRDVGAVP